MVGFDVGFPWRPLVATNADGRLEVFIIGEDKKLHHRWQSLPGLWNSTWELLGEGGAEELLVYGLRGVPVVASNADGRLEVFNVGPYDDLTGRNEKLYHRWQLHRNGRWNST